jgi:hypothetical protein
MPDKDFNPKAKEAVESPGAGKKPYQKPEFRFERVFETMALSCGKVSPTEFQCRFNRKSS